MAKSRRSKRGGGRHLGKLVPWSLVLANQLFSTGGRKNGKTRKRRGRSRRSRRSRVRRRRSRRN